MAAVRKWWWWCCCCNYAPNSSPESDPFITSDVASNSPLSMTPVETLDRLIEHLEACLKSPRLKNELSPSSEERKKSTEGIIHGFLEALDKRQSQSEVRMGKETFLPLLEKVLEGAGSLHWAAFGLLMLAWAIDNWDKQQQNAEDCLAIVKDTIFLLKHAKQQLMWTRTQQDEGSSRGPNYELMKSTLPEIAEVAFRASSIFVSCSPRPSSKIKGRLKKYIGAASLQGSIAAVKGDIKMLLQKNDLIEHQQTRGQLDRIQQQTKPILTQQLSAYHHTVDGEGVLGRSALAREVEAHLKMDSGEGIGSVCLHGMGGVGKSTLGLHVYNNLMKQKLFAVYCRVEMQLDSKEKDLPRFQEQILEAITGSSNKIHDATEGRERLAAALLRNNTSRILLYIDNMEDPELLQELLPDVKHLPQGSRLLVTTRSSYTSQYILNLPNIHPRHSKSVEVKTLSGSDSRCLLRQEALKNITDAESSRDMIIENNKTLEDLEEEVLRSCGGLPLALKVIGGFIAMKDARKPETWRYVIDAMREARGVEGKKEDRLYSSLKWSINELDEDLRRILFDFVTCELYQFFSKGELESIFGAEDLQHLLDRHLLEDLQNVLEDNRGASRVRCHDVIASLVKRMASPNELRLFKALPAELDDEAAANVVCLMGTTITDVQQICRMKRLRYAVIRVIPDHRLDCSATLRLHLQNLEALRIHGYISRSNVRYGQDLQAHGHRSRYPSISPLITISTAGCQKLRLLNLHGPVALLEEALCPVRSLSLSLREVLKLPDSMFDNHHVSLALSKLDLSGCLSLRTLPEGIGKLSCLRELYLSRCTSLETLPDTMFDNNLSVTLSKLALCRCSSLRALPQGIGKLSNLKELHLSRCTSLEKLPEDIGKLSCFQGQELNLSRCTSLEKLPDDMFDNNLTLSSIQLHGCSRLRALPEGIGKLSNLKELHLSRCTSLEKLPESLGKLSSLQELDLCECTSLQKLPDGMFDDNVLLTLSKLNLGGCSSLRTVPEGMAKLSCLEELHLSMCTSLEKLPHGMFDNNVSITLSWLLVSGCSSLRTLPEGIGKLSCLRSLDLSRCTSLEKLPDGMFDNSVPLALSKLKLYECTSLRTLPEGIKKLSRLQELDLSRCSRLEKLPDGMFDDNISVTLSRLDLNGCSSLRTLPQGIGKLCNLKKLNLCGCTSLENLPQSIEELSSLQELDLSGCTSLQKLPEGIRNPSCLQKLNLSGRTSLEKLPQGMVFDNNVGQQRPDMTGMLLVGKGPKKMKLSLQL